MAYQSLYRRYRPQRFADVRGQDHLSRALRNAVVEGRVGHAYLFSGPRGTGKTTTARILAKVLNCPNVVDGEPCGACESCVGIEHGTSFDVFELDAASNNGVEAIRNLIERAQLGSPGRTKVYILDEVHMLSVAASNALLKTLEEPPDHVVFVLATTDPQKVLPTIKSRTQHFDLHLLPVAEIEALVDAVVKDAGLDVSAEAREYVLRAGGGSARDTLSALDQVVAAGGVPDDISIVDELVEALCERDTGRALVAVDTAVTSGRSPRALGEVLVGRLRDVFLASVGAVRGQLPERERELVADQARRLGAAGSTRALEGIGEAFVGIQDAPDPRVVLEVALVRLTRPDTDHSPAAIVERLERLERGLGPTGAPGGGQEPPATPGDPAAPSGHAGSPAGGAASARQALAASRAGKGDPAGPDRPATGAPSGRAAPAAPGPIPPASPAAPGPIPPASPATTGPIPPAAPAPTAALSSAGPAVTAVANPAAATSGDLPSRDDLTLAWGDTVLATLSGRARSRFAGGRFITVADGAAVFGLPNAMHAKRCEEARDEVEAALAGHFGRPVPLRIVVDDGQPAVPGGHSHPAREPRGASSTGPAGATVEPAPDDLDDTFDISELRDATDVSSSSVDRIAEVFPGVEVVDHET